MSLYNAIPTLTERYVGDSSLAYSKAFGNLPLRSSSYKKAYGSYKIIIQFRSWLTSPVGRFIDPAPFVLHIANIVCFRSGKQMCWTNTRRIIAMVADIKIRKTTVGNQPSGALGINDTHGDIESSVTESRLSTSPCPTLLKVGTKGIDWTKRINPFRKTGFHWLRLNIANSLNCTPLTAVASVCALVWIKSLVAGFANALLGKCGFIINAHRRLISCGVTLRAATTAPQHSHACILSGLEA
jgi:hypothetical protein